MSLAQRLADRTGHTATAAELDVIDRRLADAIAEAHARWPQVGADPEDVIDAIATRVEGETELDAALARIALPDVVLVGACLRGDRGGLAAFERLVRDETGRAVARLGGGGPAAAAGGPGLV